MTNPCHEAWDADRVRKRLLVVFLEQPTCGRWVLIRRIDRLSYKGKERPTNEKTGKTEMGRSWANGEEDRPTEKGRKIALLKTLAAVIRVSLSLLLRTHFLLLRKLVIAKKDLYYWVLCQRRSRFILIGQKIRAVWAISGLQLIESSANLETRVTENLSTRLRDD